MGTLRLIFSYLSVLKTPDFLVILYPSSTYDVEEKEIPVWRFSVRHETSVFRDVVVWVPEVVTGTSTGKYDKRGRDGERTEGLSEESGHLLGISSETESETKFSLDSVSCCCSLLMYCIFLVHIEYPLLTRPVPLTPRLPPHLLPTNVKIYLTNPLWGN